MRITGIDMKGFGRFQQMTWNPGPGLNLFHGPNESGKSTLLSFVQAMLYGMRGGRRNREGCLPPLRRFEPWMGGPYQGVLTYELDDGATYRVGRNFAKGTVHLHDAYHNDITARFPIDRETGPLFAQAQLGLDAETFSRTFLVGQMQTVLDLPGRRSLMDSLLRLQEEGTAELNFRQAEEALQKALLERVGSGRSTSRPLDRILEKLEAVHTEELQIRERREAVLGTAMSLKTARMKLEALREELALQQAERGGIRRQIAAGELLSRRMAAGETRRRLDALSKEERVLAEEATAMEASLSERRMLAMVDAEAAASLPFERGRCRELLRNVDRMRDSRQKKCEERGQLEEVLPKTPVWKDMMRIEAVWKTYLEIRERVGSTEERSRVVEALLARERGRWRRWPLAVLLCLPAVAGLYLGVFSQMTFLMRGMPSLIWVAAAVLVASAVLVMLIPPGSILKPPVVNGQMCKGEALSGALARRQEIQHWNSARIQFEKLLKETEASTVQEFMNMKATVETLLRRIEGLKADETLLEEEIRRMRTEADILSGKTEALLHVVVPDTEGLPDKERVSAFQQVMQTYRQDRERVARLELERARLATERAALRETRSMEEGLSKDPHAALLPEDPAQQLLLLESARAARGQLETVEQACERLVDAVSQAAMTVATLETRLERVPTEDRLQQIVEEKDRLESRRVSLEVYGESLSIALHVLQESAAQMRQGVSPRLDLEAGRILSHLSAGRYQRVGTDAQLMLRVETPESDEMPMAGQLSGGAADQAWLAVRLASASLLEAGRETLPLFLDEPFAQFDEERTLSALRWLKEHAQKRQVFLFTCRERERALVSEVFGEQASLFGMGASAVI